jgi:hypothetical protein
MQTKTFHLGDVLSIVAGIIISPRHIRGVIGIREFMYGGKVFLSQSETALRVCKDALLEQFPQFKAMQWQRMEPELVETISGAGPEGYFAAVNWWLDKLTPLYGETLEVAVLPEDARKLIRAILPTDLSHLKDETGRYSEIQTTPYRHFDGVTSIIMSIGLPYAYDVDGKPIESKTEVTSRYE